MIRFVPNMLTIIRLLLTAVFLVMILYIPETQGRRGGVLFIDAIFVLFLVAGLTDIVDGIIARTYNAASKFGRIMDPFVDKVLVCGGFICFAIIGEPKLFDFPPAALAIIQWAAAGIITLREAAMTIVRHIAESQGINFAATVAGKLKMFVQSVAIGTILLKMAHFSDAAWANWFTLIMLIAAAAITIVSAFPGVRRAGVSSSQAAVHR
jgi:CDP-diacylglycerol--glycerol-3-phosphate 3-phosphatidyltransferase